MKHVLMLLALAALVTTSACKKKTTTEPVPDLVVNITATENGSTLASINFTAVEQVVTNSSFGGSYNSNANLFAMTAIGQLGQPGPNFGFHGPTGGVNETTHNMSSGNFTGAFNTSTEAFQAISGTLKITNVDLFAAAQGVTEYFIDGEIDMTMENNDGTRTIEVTGTFSGVNIKEN